MSQPAATPAPRVVLHVGAPKSGTTYLQRVLWRNRDELAGVAADLTAPQIVTEAQRALASASSVRIRGEYTENGKPIAVDMRLAAGDKATGVVTTDGVKVEVRRIGDQLYVKGEFIGGCDITREMFQAGELQQLFTEKGVALKQTA